MNRRRVSPVALAIKISKLWGPHFPVDVRHIAMELSRKQPDPIVKIEGLDLEGAEGFLARGKARGWGIGYSTHIREDGKINFVIGHEFGHYLCHRSDLIEGVLCTRSDILDFRTPGANEKNIEQEANVFASYLLMLIADFRQQIAGQNISIELLAACAARYNTTLSATALKLVDFTDEAVAVVLSSEGKVVWARSSIAAMRAGLYFRRDSAIPERSLTARCQAEGTRANQQSGVLVHAPIWSQTDVYESAVAQPNYGCVFTILCAPHATRHADANEEEREQDAFDRLTSSL
jgi:hypothetical protein